MGLEMTRASFRSSAIACEDIRATAQRLSALPVVSRDDYFGFADKPSERAQVQLDEQSKTVLFVHSPGEARALNVLLQHSLKQLGGDLGSPPREVQLPMSHEVVDAVNAVDRRVVSNFSIILLGSILLVFAVALMSIARIGLLVWKYLLA